jgi:hypothetical protein
LLLAALTRSDLEYICVDSHCLDLIWPEIDEGDWQYSGLRRVVIKCAVMEEENFKMIIGGLSCAPSLECLEISLRATKRNPKRKDLCLTAWQIICQFSSMFNNLLKLQLQGFSADDTSLDIRCPLVEFVLHFRHISQVETVQRQLADLIQRSSSLRKLDIVGSEFTKELALLLKEVLLIDHSLEMLTIWDVALGEDGIAAISSLIAHNCNLTEIALISCGITQTGLSSIANALKTNFNLVQLTLQEESYKFRTDEASCFIDVLSSSNSSLQILNLFIVEDDGEFLRLMDESSTINLVEFNGLSHSRILDCRKALQRQARLSLLRRIYCLQGLETENIWLISEMAGLVHFS